MSDERAHGSTEAILNTYSMNDDDLDDRIEEDKNGPLNVNEPDEHEIESMTFILGSSTLFCIRVAHTISFFSRYNKIFYLVRRSCVVCLLID